MSTAENNDSAMAGKHKVTITSKEDVLERVKADFAKESNGAERNLAPRQFLASA